MNQQYIFYFYLSFISQLNAHCELNSIDFYNQILICPPSCQICSAGTFHLFLCWYFMYVSFCANWNFISSLKSVHWTSSLSLSATPRFKTHKASLFSKKSPLLAFFWPVCPVGGYIYNLYVSKFYYVFFF
jgi:hypothetical protein